MQGNLSTASVCKVLDIPRSTWYRYVKKDSMLEETEKPNRKHFRGLSEEEKEKILNTMNSKIYRDRSPEEIHADLLDKGIYLCSVRTMYRLLQENKQNVRRYQRRTQNNPAPQLLTTKPNTLWSWDITKLLGPAKWSYFYLYTIIDVYSRFVVGWMVSFRENSQHAV